MRILVSGCSFTEQMAWPSLLFAPKKYDTVNLAASGAGNEYIASSIMFNADTKPDFVFVLWSGINRTDLRVSNSTFFKNSNNYKSRVVGKSKYFIGGGAATPDQGWLAGYNSIKAPEWPEINSLQDWFNLPESIKLECLDHKIYLSTHGGHENLEAFYHQYYMTQHLGIDREYHSERTFQNLVNCFNLLEKFDIPYRFSFIYDMFLDHHLYSLGKAVKEKYYKQIDWSRYIKLTPYEYGIKHDLLSFDNFHLTNDGMNQWAGEVSSILKKDSDLQHLF